MADDKTQKKERSFPVTYCDGERVFVKQVPWMETEDLWELLKDVLASLISSGLMPGEVMRPSNRRTWGSLDRIVSMLSLVGGGRLDVKRMDLDELVAVFLTDTPERDDTGAVVPPEKNGTYPPSRIARLHGFDFFKLRREAVNQVEEQEKQETKTANKTTEATRPKAA